MFESGQGLESQNDTSVTNFSFLKVEFPKQVPQKGIASTPYKKKLTSSLNLLEKVD